MRPDFATHDLDAEVVFDQFLGGDDLDRIQELLVSTAPRWCRNLRTWKAPRDQVPIEVSDPEALATVVLAVAGERGATDKALVVNCGRFEMRSRNDKGAGPLKRIRRLRST